MALRPTHACFFVFFAHFLSLSFRAQREISFVLRNHRDFSSRSLPRAHHRTCTLLEMTERGLLEMTGFVAASSQRGCAGSNSAAEAVSRKTVTLGCVRKIEAGA